MAIDGPKDKQFLKGYRGSSSEQASSKKLGGHKWEKVFADLIGGYKAPGKATRKTDVIGPDVMGSPDEKKYSVKGSSPKGKWQISLFGINRFRNDQDFNKTSNLGDLYVEYLESFPDNDDKDKYFIDKKEAKGLMTEFHKMNDRKPFENEYLSFIKEDNLYLQGKLGAKKVTSKIRDLLKEKTNLRDLLSKHIFNHNVDYWAILEDETAKVIRFLVFEKNDVLDVFTNNLEPSISHFKLGRKNDINMTGQKVTLLLNDEKILAEPIDPRIEPTHYREIRFSMLREKALHLLLENFAFDTERYQNVLFYKKI